ncbi:unnamed protein product [Rhodiola kirilowii]
MEDCISVSPARRAAAVGVILLAATAMLSTRLDWT